MRSSLDLSFLLKDRDFEDEVINTYRMDKYEVKNNEVNSSSGNGGLT